jgi:hypothetical protein
MSETLTKNLYVSSSGDYDLLSNAWRLYRINFKTVLQYAIIPVTLFALIFSVFKPDDLPLIFFLAEQIIVNPGIAMTFFIFFVGLNLFLFKLFIKLSYREVPDIHYLLHFLKLNLLNTFRISFLIVFELILFLILDSVILLIVMFSIAAIFYALDELIRNLFFRDIYYTIILITMIIYFLIAAYIVMLEVLFLGFQVSALATEEISVRYTFVIAVKIFYDNIIRFIKYGCITATLIYVLYMNIYTIIYLVWIVFWLLIEQIVPMDGFYQKSESYLDIFAFSLCLIFLWPFFISSIIVFYNNYKARKEGFDISYAINKEIKKENEF